MQSEETRSIDDVHDRLWHLPSFIKIVVSSPVVGKEIRRCVELRPCCSKVTKKEDVQLLLYGLQSLCSCVREQIEQQGERTNAWLQTMEEIDRALIVRRRMKR